MSAVDVSAGSGDEPDPFHHFKSDRPDILPEQPPVHKGLTHLDHLGISLNVDGAPGCGGNIWIAGRVSVIRLTPYYLPISFMILLILQVLSDYLVYRNEPLHGKRVLELGGLTSPSPSPLSDQ